MIEPALQLLNDGRVLVSGSDPQTLNPDGSVKYPEEMRIEVYIPPYLNQGRTQPSFTIQNTDWTYNGAYLIQVTLHHGNTAGMRVSLVAGTSLRALAHSLDQVLTSSGDVQPLRVRMGTRWAVALSSPRSAASETHAR